MSWKQILRARSLERDETDHTLIKELRRAMPVYKTPRDVKAWQRDAKALRKRALDEVYLTNYPKAVVKAKGVPTWCGDLTPEAPYRVRKLRYEAVPNYWVPALLYEPHGLRGKAPVVLIAQGHCAGGKAAQFIQVLLANVARLGMIGMTFEFPGMGELQADRLHFQQTQLTLTGLPGVGVFYLAMQKGLDVLLSHRHADPKRVAMTGLSGGGWQTITLSSLDPRITLAVPVAGYTTMHARAGCEPDIGDPEQNPPDLATVCDYQHLTAMLAPRPVLQILNEYDDCCFKTHRARPVIYDAMRPLWKAFGKPDHLAHHSNHDPGTHNYSEDNRAQFLRFVCEHFGVDPSPLDAGELHASAELFTEEQLNSGLPLEQETFLSLARSRARQLAAKHRMPKSAADRRALRKQLVDVLRLPTYKPMVRQQRARGNASLHVVKAGPWRVPLSANIPQGCDNATLLVNDPGRDSSLVPSPPPRDRAFFVADIFGTGEGKPHTNRTQLIEAVGQRMLGIQVAQTVVCAEIATRKAGVKRITLEGHGHTCSTVALLAAALRPGLFDRLVITWELETFVYLIEHSMSWQEHPSLFCRGLLEVADVPQIRQLLEHVVLELPGRGGPPARYRDGESEAVA